MQNNERKFFDLEIAKKMYLEENRSLHEIAKVFGFRTPKSIGDKLKSAGVCIRTSQNAHTIKKSYSDNILERIDTEWKGYFLGLLLTDGWITSRSDNLVDIVGLSSVDRDVIEYISLCTGKSIQTVDHSVGTKIGPLGTEINRKTEYRIVLNSTKIVSDLERLGVVERKTNILKGPDLTFEEMKFLPQILRGIIDGDGTFGFPSNNENSVYFRIVSASEDFIDWCIHSLNILGMRNINKRMCTDSMWELNTAQHSNISILVNSIYQGQFGMNRKREKLLTVFNKRFNCDPQ